MAITGTAGEIAALSAATQKAIISASAAAVAALDTGKDEQRVKEARVASAAAASAAATAANTAIVAGITEA